MTALRKSDPVQALPLRPVRQDDAETLFAWANLPEVLAVSIRRRGAVQWDEHRAWLAERLGDPQSAFWILEIDGAAAGYLRLQGGEDGPEVSIYVGPAARRRGLGLAMLTRAREEQAARWPGHALLARVRPDNGAARAIFEAAGYRLSETRADCLLYIDALATTETADRPGEDDSAKQTALSVIYADSRDAVMLAWPDGVPEGIAIRSNAPALLADPDIQVDRADEQLTPDHIHALVAALDGAASAVRHEIAESGLAGSAEAAFAVFSALVGELQNHVCTAAMLRESDLDGGAQAVAVRYANGDLQRRFRFTLADVFAECGIEPIEVDGERLPPIGEPTPPHPNLWTRLIHTTAESLVFRLGKGLQGRMPFMGRRGTIAIYRENELLKETAAHLLLRGYAIRAIRRGRDKGKPQPSPIDIAPIAAAALRRHLGAVMPDRVADALGRIGGRLATDRLDAFIAARESWRIQLEGTGDRPRAVLSNRLHSADYWAMYSVLSEAGIPLVAFQHGVTPEFAADRVDKTHGHENTGADLSIVFNPEMERLLGENPDARGPAVSVGMPKDYRRLDHRRSAHSIAPIWYIRTTLYQSNLGRMHRGIVDPAMYEQERLLIERVFSQIPHRLAYKPYPAIRYLDPDPVDALVRAAPNMTLYDGRLDLRYVVAGARLLITSAASSTLSWCLMAGRPLVFLDWPHFTPLQPEVREALKKAVFLFDMSEADAPERLRDFLSQPLERIDADWRDKAAASRAFIARYVDSGRLNAGFVAADAVENLLAQRAGNGGA